MEISSHYEVLRNAKLIFNGEIAEKQIQEMETLFCFNARTSVALGRLWNGAFYFWLSAREVNMGGE